MPAERPPLSSLSAVAALVVLGLLGLLTLRDMVDGPDDIRAELLAPTPALPDSPRAAVRYLADARHYLAHRYALRDWMIESNSTAHLTLFGRSAYPDVLIGRDGFLFLATEGTIPLLQGADPLSDAEAGGWRRLFAAQDAAFRRAGIPFVFVLAPSKHTIYRDLLPAWLRPGAWPVPGYRTDTILRLARDELALAPTDLRPVLEQARAAEAGPLYHRTDTHWNERGAAIALQAVLADAGIATSMPDMRAVPTGAGGDLARMMGQQPQRSEDAPTIDRTGWTCVGPDGAPLPIVTIDPILPRRFACTGDRGQDLHVVAFIDSFGVAAVPFLAANFNTVTVVWSNAPDAALARQFGADLVLNILVERRVQTADPLTMMPPDAPG